MSHVAEIFTERATQLYVLLYKNTLLIKRRWKFSLLRLLHSALFVLILWLLNAQHNSSQNKSAAAPPVDVPVGPLPNCKGPNCITILYSPFDDPGAHAVMSTIAKYNNLRIPSFDDMQQMNVTSANYPEYDILAVESSKTIEWFLEHNFNTTMTAVAFNDSNIQPYNPYNIDLSTYQIYYNDTSSSPISLSGSGSVYDLPLAYILQLQVMVEASIVEYLTQRPTMYNIATRKYPYVVSQDQQTDRNPEIIAYYLAIPLLLCTFYMTIIITLNEIREDQTTRLRQGLVMMGMKELPYWLHWFLTQAAFVIVGSLLCILVGYITGLSLFRNVNFFVLFFAFVAYGVSCFSYGFFFSTFLKTPTKANIFIVFVFLFSFSLSLLYLAPGNLGYPVMNIPFVGRIIQRFPGIDFAQIIGDVSYNSTYFQNSTDGSYHLGPGYHWKDLYKPNPYNADGEIFRQTDSAFYSIIFNIVFFALLAWYIDNVRPGEFGSRKPLYFFLLPSYWGFGARAAPNVAVYKHNMRKMSSVLPDMDKDITREYQQTMNAAQTNSESGVIILKLSKTYDGGARALDALTCVGSEGSVLCLLGHNGAGKTTAISLMTGLYSVSSGDALLYGHSVMYEMDHIRKIMGVCPQHDILWGDLTAKEHIYMFAKLKGIQNPDLEIAERLRDVRLDNVRDHFSATFSGGMKRRLSVAIASIGNPKIIFMDEPTSGLDPRSRLHVTQLVQRLKQNRVIVLTTHSMEEADALGDKIAILALGRLRAVGDGLHLKSRYGAGYHINLVCEQNKNEEVSRLISDQFPTTKLVYQSAGNLVYTLPYHNADDVANFFSWIERGVNYISDWGVSHTTLEEVFLRITHGSNEGELDLNEQLGISITLEGDSAPLGTILIDRQTTLAQARFLISSEIPNVPMQFVFLNNGMPLNYAQENVKLAYTFAPSIIVKQHTASSNANETAIPDPQWREERAQLIQESQQAKAAVSRLEDENRDLRARLEEIERRFSQLNQLNLNASSS